MDKTMRVDSDAERIQRLERQSEQEQLLRLRLGDLEIENRRLAAERVAAEQRLGQLSQLQAALLQLHEAPTPNDVQRVIKEIVANLIGSEEMGIYLRQADDSLRLVDGISAESGTPLPPEPGEGIVSIPLRHNDRVLGLIAIFRLLPQKRGIDPIDRDLFALLSTHATIAFENAVLRARATRPGRDG